jgi:sugar phosphate isomerase/epimerase
LLQLKIGLDLASLQLPFPQALLTAARLGVEGVEIDVRNFLSLDDLSKTGVRQIRKMLEDTNLRVSSVAFPTRRGYETLQELDRRVEATKRAMQLAWDLRCNIVVNHVGNIPTDEADPAWTTLNHVLMDLGNFGHKVGVTFCAKTGNESAEVLQKLLQALPDQCLGIDFNPGALLMNGFAPSDAATLLGKHIQHFRAVDAVRGVSRHLGETTLLGRGSCEIPLLLAILEQHEYRGYVTIQRQGQDSLGSELANAMEYLKRL